MQEMQTVKQRVKKAWRKKAGRHEGAPRTRGPPRTPSTARQHPGSTWARPPAHHGRLSMPPEDDHHGQGAEEAQRGQQDHGYGGGLIPFEEGQLPLEAGGIFPVGPLGTWAGLASQIHLQSPGQLLSLNPPSQHPPSPRLHWAWSPPEETELWATNAH